MRNDSNIKKKNYYQTSLLRMHSPLAQVDSSWEQAPEVGGFILATEVFKVGR